MKKIYREFFHIPKYGKIREKVILCRTAITVVVIIFCLTAMSITAYAYFSCNVTSGSNIIKAANFQAQISIIEIDENNTPVKSVEPSSTDGKKTAFTFTDTGTYTVKLTKGNSTADTGFCIVNIGEDKYHTQQIDVTADNQEPKAVEFIIKVNTPNTVITIESHWGTSSYYDGFKSDAQNAFYIVNNNPKREIIIGTPAKETNDSDELNETTEESLSTTTLSDVTHIVAKGENLTQIAEKYNTTVERIADYNKLSNPSNIQTGQVLIIPVDNSKTPVDTEIQSTTPPSETTPPTTEITPPITEASPPTSTEATE